MWETSHKFNLHPRQTLKVPLVVESVRNRIHAHRDPTRPPILSFEEILKILDFIKKPSIALKVIESLHAMGDVIFLKWKDLHSNEHRYVVYDPKWLANLLSTIVTFRHNFVTNGEITRTKLVSLWSHYGRDLLEPLIQLMSQLDVMIKMEDVGSSERDGGTFLIPCLLPFQKPDFIQETLQDSHIIRRSFLFENGLSLPIGLIGKMISIAIRWGRVKCAWRNGCIVERDDVLFCVKREWTKDGNPSASSLTCSNFACSSSFLSSSSSFPFEGVHLLVSTVTRCDTISSVFRQFQTAIRNLFDEYYSLGNVFMFCVV